LGYERTDDGVSGTCENYAIVGLFHLLMRHVSALRARDDPFGEQYATALHRRVRVLGGDFDFQSGSRRLLGLVDAAYRGLPVHVLGKPPPRFSVRLRLTEGDGPEVQDGPPSMRMHGGAGLLCGVIDTANFAIVAPAQRSALVAVSQGLLRYPYHARYELIEFAVYALAARAQRLLSLHGACVGREGRGVLLIGASGAGKSTLALHCLLRGMEFLSEDSVFVEPATLRATGVASFLHLRTDSSHFATPAQSAWIERAPVIRRRSGVAKFEVDLRRSRYRIAPAPLQIRGVVFVSGRAPSRRTGLLVPIDKSVAAAKLRASQFYAPSQPGWSQFARRIARLPAVELRRAPHPSEAAAAVETLL
jgi:hypothetical protein